MKKKELKTEVESQDKREPKIQEIREEGITWLFSYQSYFQEPELTVDHIRDLKDNIYLAGVLEKQKNLIFTGDISVVVTNEKGDEDDELSAEVTSMCQQPDVRLQSKIRVAFDEIFTFGAAFFNPVWTVQDNKYKLIKLRQLPAHSFGSLPLDAMRRYSKLLQGVTYNETKKIIEYFQTQNIDEYSQIEQIHNIFHVKNPESRDLAGLPILLPLIPIIRMLKYAWEMEMQKAQRIGAPLLLLKITNPQGPTQANGGVGDVEYGKLFIQNYGKGTAYILRENFELIDPKIVDTQTAMEIIEALHALIIDYFSPSSFISTKSGQLIASSDRPQHELMLQYVAGVHAWLTDAFELLLQQYLSYNGYEGYLVNIHIPEPEIDRSELQLKQAHEALVSTRPSLTLNEIRERLGAEPLSDEELEKLIEESERFGSPAAAMAKLNEETLNAISMENLRRWRIKEAAALEAKTTAEISSALDELYENVEKALANESTAE